MKWLMLKGFLVLKSSKNRCQVVFDREVPWKQNMRIGAWVALPSCNKGLTKLFPMRAMALLIVRAPPAFRQVCKLIPYLVLEEAVALEFKEVVVKRRSVRKFKKDAIPEKLLGNVLEAGRWAPSAGNSQPWRFLAVTDPETKAKIASNCTSSSKEHWKQFSPARAKYIAARGGSWDKSYMRDIPILIVVFCKLPENMSRELAMGSVWMAVENMLLAATDEGLGSCVYTFLNRNEENKLKRILNASQRDRIACIVQLGYTKTEPIAPCRKQLSEIVSHEHF